MRPVNLVNFRTSEVNIINHVDVSDEPVSITCSHHVSSDIAHTCKCISKIEISRNSEKDTAEKTLCINITVEAQLEISDSSLTKEDLHQCAVRETFPFLRSAVSSIMTACGFHPIFLSSAVIGE